MNKTHKVTLFLVINCLTFLFVRISHAESLIQREANINFLKLPESFKLGACSAVDINSRGEIFLLHRGKHPIICVNSKGEYLHSWGDDILNKGHGLRVDQDDNVWVTDTMLHMVFKFDSRGKLLLGLGQAAKPGSNNDQFNQPTDIAFGPDGAIYISDGYGNSRVMKFKSDGRFLKKWGIKGKRHGEFNLPHSIIVDIQGRVLVGDRENNRIQIFNAEGKYLDCWSGFAPYGMELSTQNKLYVADGRANQIMQLNSKGKMVRRWGRQGKGVGEFQLPHMLAADTHGNLYIAEVGGRRFQILKLKSPMRK